MADIDFPPPADSAVAPAVPAPAPVVVTGPVPDPKGAEAFFALACKSSGPVKLQSGPILTPIELFATAYAQPDVSPAMLESAALSVAVAQLTKNWTAPPPEELQKARHILIPFASTSLPTLGQLVGLGCLYPLNAQIELRGNIVVTHKDLFLTAIHHYPKSYSAYCNLARLLAPGERVTLRGGETLNEAGLLLKAVHLNPTSAYAFNALAVALPQGGSVSLIKGDKMTKDQLLIKAIELDPRLCYPYANLATNLAADAPPVKLGASVSLDRKGLLEKAIELNPAFAAAYDSLAQVLPKGETAKIGGQNLDQKALLFKAIELNPGLSSAFNRLGNLSTPFSKTKLPDGRELGQRDFYLQSIHLDPVSTFAYGNLAQLLDSKETVKLLDGKEMTKQAMILNALQVNPHDSHLVSELLDSEYTVDATNLDSRRKTPQDIYNLKVTDSKNDLDLKDPLQLNLVARTFSNLVSLEICNQGLELIHGLEELVHLVSLDVSHNKITSLPLKLEKLRILTKINLSDNKLRSVVELVALRHLKFVDISSNDISEFPLELAEEQKEFPLEELVCHTNPLLPPLKILGPKATSTSPLAFIRDLLKLGGKPWIQIKVVFCGKGGVGKTHLTHCLQNLPYPYPTNQATDGLKIHVVRSDDPKKAVQFCVFDLGGQEVFYPTHHFFIGGKALFVVVFKANEVDKTHIEYWIRAAKSHQPNSAPRILLVGTHIENMSQTALAAIANDLKQYSKITPIQGTYFVSCKPTLFQGDGGVSDLKKVLITQALESTLFQQVVPAYYRDVADMIIARRENNPYQDVSELKEKFVSVVLPHVTNEQFTNLVTFLNETGVITWFNQPETKDWVILDPQWLADVMKGLVSFRHKWKDGKVKRLDITQAWKDFRAGFHTALLKILEKFEILYPVTNDLWAIPCMLEREKTPGFIKEETDIKTGTGNFMCYKVIRTIKFGFVPKGFFSRLHVQLMHLENVKHVDSWFNGLIVEDLVAYQISAADYGAQFQAAVQYSNIKERLLLEYDDINNILTITGIIPPKKGLGLFVNVLNAVAGIIEEGYKSAAGYSSQATCTHCLQSNSPNPAVIDTRDIALHFAKGNWTYECPNTKGVPSPIPLITPDLCLGHVKVIDPKHLHNLTEIAKGGFGIVSKGDWWIEDDSRIQRVVAVKQPIHKPEPDEAEEVALEREFKEWHLETFLMSKLDHPNVIKLHGILLNPVRNVMEFCNGSDYHQFLKQRGSSISWAVKVKILMDVAKGMAHLASQKPAIVHRDLRSPNIFMVIDPLHLKTPDESLLPLDVTAKVADLGKARQAVTNLIERLANWDWLAPEVYTSTSAGYDARSDIFSFAILIWHTMHPNSWPYCLNPEHRREDKRLVTPAELEKEPNLLQDLKDNVGEGFYREEPGANGILVVRQIHIEMSITKAIRESNFRPLVSDQARESAPAGLIELMQQCWATSAAERPAFADIAHRLQTILDAIPPAEPQPKGPVDTTNA